MGCKLERNNLFMIFGLKGRDQLRVNRSLKGRKTIRDILEAPGMRNMATEMDEPRSGR